MIDQNFDKNENPDPNTSAFEEGELLKFSGRQDRITVYQPQHEWARGVRSKLKDLCALPKGWNGYDAPPVSFTTANFALRMLESIVGRDAPTPQIVPGVDGDLQIEWHLLKGDIELHVRSSNDVLAWRSTDQDEDGEELRLKTDFKDVATWLAQIM